jgi:protein-tyrosine phosphatase
MTTRVLFVCLGNICRSPLAAGIFRDLVSQRGLDGEIVSDSAGTGAWHAGEPADPRSNDVASLHGVDLNGHRARQVNSRDFEVFDLLVAMDRENVTDLKQAAPEAGRHKIHLLRDHDPEGPGDVPDPYWGGPQGFEIVYRMIERSCEALLDALQRGQRRDRAADVEP